MELTLGVKYPVTVVELKDFGAIVELSDATTSLIHISKISDCYVRDVADFLSVGMELTAVGVEGKNRPVELSLTHLNLKPLYHTTRSRRVLNGSRTERPEALPNFNRVHTSASPSKSASRSLEDMIEDSDAVLKDKFRKYNLDACRVRKEGDRNGSRKRRRSR